MKHNDKHRVIPPGGLSNRPFPPSSKDNSRPSGSPEATRFKIQDSSLEERVKKLEERVRILEHMSGIYSTPESIDEFLKSESGRAEYRAALVQLSVYRNQKPLAEFVVKTGGRVPR